MDSKNGYLLNGRRGDSLSQLTFEDYCAKRAEKPKAFFKHYSNKLSDGRNYSQEFLETQKIYFSDPLFFEAMFRIFCKCLPP